MSMQDKLTGVGLLRLWEILGNEETPAIVPVSRSTWYAGIRSGRYPKPCKISPRISAWRREDILNLIIALKNRGD